MSSRSETDPSWDETLEPRVDWDPERLQREWSHWDEAEREWYSYWLEIAKTYTDETTPELVPAQYAAMKVLERRRGLWPPNWWRERVWPKSTT